MKCLEYKTCADYHTESLRCCFMYRWCQTRRDIEQARTHMIGERLKRLGGQGKSLDAFEDVEVWRGDTE